MAELWLTVSPCSTCAGRTLGRAGVYLGQHVDAGFLVERMDRIASCSLACVMGCSSEQLCAHTSESVWSASVSAFLRFLGAMCGTGDR